MEIWTISSIIAKQSNPHPGPLSCGGRGEEIIQADMPIVEYRKKRERLKQHGIG
jgi:hypothetical protein